MISSVNNRWMEIKILQNIIWSNSGELWKHGFYFFGAMNLLYLIYKTWKFQNLTHGHGTKGKFFFLSLENYNKEHPRQGAFQSWSGSQQCDEVCGTALRSPGGRTCLNRSALNPAHYEMAPVKASGSIISSWGIIFRAMLREISPCASPLAFASLLSSCLLTACPAIYTAATP